MTSLSCWINHSASRLHLMWCNIVKFRQYLNYFYMLFLLLADKNGLPWISIVLRIKWKSIHHLDAVYPLAFGLSTAHLALSQFCPSRSRWPFSSSRELHSLCLSLAQGVHMAFSSASSSLLTQPSQYHHSTLHLKMIWSFFITCIDFIGVFLWPRPWHMEVLGPEIEPVPLQQPQLLQLDP